MRLSSLKFNVNFLYSRLSSLSFLLALSLTLFLVSLISPSRSEATTFSGSSFVSAFYGVRSVTNEQTLGYSELNFPPYSLYNSYFANKISVNTSRYNYSLVSAVPKQTTTSVSSNTLLEQYTDANPDGSFTTQSFTTNSSTPLYTNTINWTSDYRFMSGRTASILASYNNTPTNYYHRFEQYFYNDELSYINLKSSFPSNSKIKCALTFLVDLTAYQNIDLYDFTTLPLDIYTDVSTKITVKPKTVYLQSSSIKTTTYPAGAPSLPLITAKKSAYVDYEFYIKPQDVASIKLSIQAPWTDSYIFVTLSSSYFTLAPAAPDWNYSPFQPNDTILENLKNMFIDAWNTFKNGLSLNFQIDPIPSGLSNMEYTFFGKIYNFDFADFASFFQKIHFVIVTTASVFAIKIISKAWGY